ncbi:unnamed protein product [Adineta steineri]|uniref:Uncharacterized protein n=2 Tax=Adineta steineri TaxID=433720 RepID=A0A814FP56_9BILA|nr:unnamed protein product [Adineta steineri]CAF1010146.1 unnamed protein product [Adineta steineri]CAF1062159.1 unnamed protein product [Adineta steineri]
MDGSNQLTIDDDNNNVVRISQKTIDKVVTGIKIHYGNAITREEINALLNDISYSDISDHSHPHSQEQQHNERDGVVLVHEKHFAAAMIGAEPSIRRDEILKDEIITGVVKHLRNLSQPQQLQDNAGDNWWSKLIW